MSAKQTNLLDVAFKEELLIRIPDLVADVISCHVKQRVFCLIRRLRASDVNRVPLDRLGRKAPLRETSGNPRHTREGAFLLYGLRSTEHKVFTGSLVARMAEGAAVIVHRKTVFVLTRRAGLMSLDGLSHSRFLRGFAPSY